MAPRSVASATLSFGLVSIPVKLYSATSPSSGISFNLLHKGCGSRLKQQYLCAKEGVIVEREAMVKGYEFAKDQYVLFTPEELDALEAKSTQSIDIAEFIPEEAIDPVFFDKPYFLGPDKGGERAYRLLGEAMRQTEKVAIARYAARGKQYLVMIRPVEGGLALHQLLYSDEVRTIKDVPIPDGDIRDPELHLAKQLISQISSQTFDPTKYEDDVKKRMLEAIERKVSGAEVTVGAPVGQTAQVIDIMAALKASLEAPKAAANETRAPASEPPVAGDDGGPPIAKARPVKIRGQVKSSKAK
jgi:DNA end-binding protein Ku